MASIRKRGESYEVRIFRQNGNEPTKLTKTFKKHADALAWAHATEAKLDKGERVNTKAAHFMFSRACDVFAAHYRPKGATKDGELSKREAQLVAGVRAFLCGENLKYDKSVASITRETLQGFIDALLKAPISEPANVKKRSIYYDCGRARTYAPSTVRHHFFQVKKILQWHSRREKYPLDPDLFAGLHIPSAWAGKRERRMEAGEREAIENAARTGRKLGAEWLLLMRFALTTGARAQEIIKARWEHISLPRKTWDIPPENVKTSTFRQVPLPREAAAVLEELKALDKRTQAERDADPRPFHFWADTSTLSKGWRRLCVRAKVKGLTFHDLRHEAICQLFEYTTLTDAEIMSISGHTNISTLRGYMKLRPNLLADKIDAGLSRARAASNPPATPQ